MSRLQESFLQALISAHSLPADTVSSYHGGSSFTSTSKLTSSTKGISYFLKTTSEGKEAQAMLLGEFTSLKAIFSAVPTFCPEPIAHGTLNGTAYLLTSFLHLDGRGGRTDAEQRNLARSLAQLH